jgi:hypothetical protein
MTPIAGPMKSSTVPHKTGFRELERSLQAIQEMTLANHLVLVDHSGNILFDSNDGTPKSCIDCFRENTATIHDPAAQRDYINSVISQIQLVPAGASTEADRLSLECILEDCPEMPT